MGQWSSKERLQPSLLDRLTDHDPEKRKESATQQVLSQRQFKDAVIRDVGWLLNSVSMDCVVDLSPYPEVSRSVLNYGLPEISGQTSSSVDVVALEKMLLEIIRRYEPRIISNSLQVNVTSNPEEMNHNALIFEIKGHVFGQPMPFQIVLRSELELESTNFSISEAT